MVKPLYISANLICRGRKGGGWCEELRRRRRGSIRKIINYINNIPVTFNKFQNPRYFPKIKKTHR